MYEPYTRSIFDRYKLVSERDLREAMQRTQTYLVGNYCRRSCATQRMNSVVCCDTTKPEQHEYWLGLLF
jgi:hypothetical protein